ncbi:VPS9 domain-containing protein 1 isoform X2 [Thalassophryne amazonica]|uniref:VPS9 domain-containing protein 1 isoform X2 n=1 Tax=Thalassophryne amazonica TaxID=390379 RepID=UPI001471E2AA|nr:VPS9 domain-containing protein 1 isoform X2 [Thalassophryne amazonica]XP_034031561.1 VPS9 domain-containing protein 1 isoform X2 [Thalassophryne amazonica]
MAAADGDVKPLQSAMKLAKSAIQLDADSRHQEAYCEYLRTINFISLTLLDEAVSQKDRDVVEVDRMLRLAEQCLERAKSSVEKSGAPPHSSVSTCVSSSGPRSQPETPLPIVTPAAGAEKKSSSPTKSGSSRAPSDGGGEQSSFLSPEVFHRLQTADMYRTELTPVEEASLLNLKLKLKYEARLARLAPGQSHQKTSLSLSLQRQMMENIVIAKARQEALQRKMEERRLRLQEEANRRFAASGSVSVEEEEQRVLYTSVLEYEQDHDWPKLWKAKLKENPDDVTLVSGLVSYLLSRSDHPVVKLLRKHQFQVYNRLYPIVSKGLHQSPARSPRSHDHPNKLPADTQRTAPASGQSFSTKPSLYHRLEDNSGDDEAELCTRLTGTKENSFEDLELFLTQVDWTRPHVDIDETKCVSDPTCESSIQLEEDEHVVQELEVRALKEHLKAIVNDIHFATDQLLSLCLLSFESLNTASSKDLCFASIEEAFFTPLWAALVALFRKVHRERELAYERSMKLYRDASPADLGMPLKLFPQEPSVLHGSAPYQPAVEELMHLVTGGCPQKKLQCIVRTLRLICACAEDYQCVHEVDSAPKTAAIGADDLLPVLSFVALRCGCPQLVSECAAVEEFIHEGYLIGEEGYCLTSMQSALAYVESLHMHTDVSLTDASCPL